MSERALVIVESPAKANTIKKFLGRGYQVVASVGHIMDLPKNELGVDISNGFVPTYVVPKGKRKIISEIKKAAKNSSKVFLALDMDREGEAIAWHLQNLLAPVQDHIKRIIFNEVTKAAILGAIASPTCVDQKKVDAQQARRILDRLVGYLISPILWQIFYYGLSAGRVQTVGLRLVCEREDEISSFQSEEYWTVEARLLTLEKREFLAKLSQKNGEKIELKTKADVDPILSELEGSSFLVEKVVRKEKRRNPQPPYITSTMQRDAARRLKFSARKIMIVAQQLYEGLDLGKEIRVGLITYMRTDSVRVGEGARERARSYIEKNFGREHLPKRPKSFRQKKEAQDAHEAIRPTDVYRTPELVKPYLSKDQFALYELIWRRFLASQMESAVYDTTEVSIRAGAYTLRASGRVMTFPGFLSVYDESIQEEGRELPPMKEGDTLFPRSIDGIQHFTEPPPRYTEATLIKELEEKGIGRPSTYANIVSIIQERDYVVKREGRLLPTTLGKQVWLTLLSFFPKLFGTSFTAQMEEELDKVEGGEDSWQNVVQDFYRPFKKSLDQIEGKKERIKSSLQEETKVSCDKCGRKLIKKWGKNGQFLACPAYPDCRFSRPLEEEVSSLHLDAKCPLCGSRLVMKVGRYGKFAACERYPSCRHTEAYPIGMDCPVNGCDGQVVEKVTRRGKTFYGCSRYPGCSFASWYKPAPHTCPNCQNTYLVEQASKNRGIYLKCPKCREEVPLD